MAIQPRGFFVFTLLVLLFAVSAHAQRVPQRPLIPEAVDDNQLVMLKGSTHPLARPQFDVGTAPSDLPLRRMLLVLKRGPEQEGALRKLLDDQQDKASPNYHKWLTPDEFGAQFGAADQDIQAVTGWLQGHGLQVNRVTHGKTIIEFTGVESQVEEALHTEIHKYLVNGEEHWANATDPQIPAALAPAVAGVRALNNFRPTRFSHLLGAFERDRSTGRVTPAAGTKPLFTFPAGGCGVQPQNCYAVGPWDFATIYDSLPAWNASPAIDGTGETIAIVGETDINLQDVAAFRNFFGLPPYNQPGGPTLKVVHDGPAPGILQDGEEAESDLDVQWSGGVAKGANVDFVVAESTETTFGIDLAALHIVDNNLAPVMSESYGNCELFIGTAGNQFFSAMWQQAAAQGITVMLSSGDGSSAGCDDFNAGGPATHGLAVSGYSSTPYNISVGGTDFDDLTNALSFWSTSNAVTTRSSALSYVPETTWDDNCTNPVFGDLLGFSKNAEANCNNSQLINFGFVNIVGGSGGKSSCIQSDGQNPLSCTGGYPKPSWQNAPGVPTDGVRDVPDVSLFAAVGSPSGSFYIICEADLVGGSSCDPNNPGTGFLGIGGTSASSPAFAGIMALVNQQQQSRQGNANFVLYNLARNAPSAFHDVKTGTIRVPCKTNSRDCKTANGADKFGILNGYDTATGYDLATGIGSIDVNNLLQNWNLAKFTATTTTLHLDPTTNITHGQTVNVTSGVAPTSGSGTPTGVVSLLTSTGLGVGAFSLTGGAISSSTSLLPGGTYTLQAQYSGDATFASSESATVPITVAPESSKTFANLVTLSNNGLITSFAANNATYGDGFFLLRVDVGDAGASVSTSTGISSNCSKGISSCPTGPISVSANGSPLAGGSLPLNIAGFAEDQSLAPGSYSVTAHYPGDTSYEASSTTTNFTINKAPTTATAGVASLSVRYGNSQQIDGGVLTNSNGVAPTGTLSFFTDGSPTKLVFGGLVYEGLPAGRSGPATLGASGSTVFLSVGNHNLSVQYSGDANYAASTSPATVVTVTQAQSFFLGWGASPNPANWQQAVTLTGNVDGSEFGAAPTGTMIFSDNGTALAGNVTYTPNPPGFASGVLQATMTYVPASPGTHNITATYSGDSNYISSSTPIPNILTVGGPFSVTPNGNVIVASPGQSASTTLTLAPNGGFTGTVTLTCSPAPAAKESTCNFGSGTSPSSSVQVTLSGSTANVTFNVSTMGPHARSATLFGGGGVFVFAGLLMLPLTRRRYRIMLDVCALAVILTLAGCGGGGGGSGGGGGGNTDPGTGIGNYTFIVTGTTGSGANAISVSSNVSVSVQ